MLSSIPDHVSSGLFACSSSDKRLCRSTKHCAAYGHSIVEMTVGHFLFACSNIVRTLYHISLFLDSTTAFWWCAPTPQNVIV